MLQSIGHEAVGLDSGYSKDCLLAPEGECFKQLNKDFRDVAISDLEGIDGVIHLAGLSNDPLGELAPGIAEESNYAGTIRLAELVKQSHVGIMYSSSQSMCGVSETDLELDEDLSTKNPITTYARTKWDAELRLKELQSPSFLICAFRPSTVFGVSLRLRCDIVQ
jgi:nucleoside-diphosphate-sugar epimerase